MSEEYPCKICRGTGIQHHYVLFKPQDASFRCECSFLERCNEKCKLVKGTNPCETCGGKGYLNWIEVVFIRKYYG